MALNDAPISIRITANPQDLDKALASAIRRVEAFSNKMEAKLGTSFKPFQGGAQGAEQSIKGVTQAAQNLSFQLNDIGVSLAGGQSPFMVMIQQGSQVAGVFQQLQAQGGSIGQALRGAFTSLLNPMSLVSFAVIGLTGVAYKFFTEWSAGAEEGASATEEMTKATEELVSATNKLRASRGMKPLDLSQSRAQQVLALRDALAAGETATTELGEAIGKVNKAILGLPATAFEGQTHTIKLVESAMGRLEQGIKNGTINMDEFVKSIEQIKGRANLPDDIRKALDDMLRVAKALTPEINATNEAIAALRKSISDTTISMDTIGTAMEHLENSIFPGFRTAYEMNIGGMKDSTDELIRKITVDLPEAYRSTQTFFKNLPPLGTLSPITSGAGVFNPSQTQMENFNALEKNFGGQSAMVLINKAVSARIAENLQKLDQAFGERAAAFLAQYPEVKINSAYRTFAEQKAIYDSGVRPAATPGKSRHEVGEALDLSFGGMSAAEIKAMQAAAKDFGLEFPLPGTDAGHLQLIKETTKGLTDEQRAAKQAAEAYSKLTDSQRESISMQEFENKVNADTALTASQKVYIIEREKVLRDLNAAAQRTGNELTQEEIANNTKLADAAGRAAQAKYDQAHSTRELTAAQKELASQIDQMEGAAGSALSQFVIDLKNGVSAGEAFRNMINSLIDELIRMAVQAMIIKPLFDALRGGFGLPTSAASAVGAAKSGGIVGFTGLAKHRVSPFAFAGAPSMARGGMVGFDPNAFPIIAHRGEIVIPTSALRKSATQTRQGGGDVRVDGRSNIRVDIANGGGTSATQASSIEFAQLLDRSVQAVIVRESRPGGLLRQQQGVR